MKVARTTTPVVITALALTVVGCARPAGAPSSMSVPADPPAALAIVTTQPQADLPAVAALVSGSAQTGERLEIVSGSGTLLSSAAAPPPPVLGAPTPPPSLSPDPTQFQVSTHQRQERAYAADLTADRGVLTRALASRLAAWAATATTEARIRVGDRPQTGSSPQPGIAAATAFFASLQGAGLNLGPRRVLVIFGASGLPGRIPSLQPGSLSGITVIIADFHDTVRAQQEWQASLLLAGAARAIVLVPAAADELTQVTRQGLAGQAGPALAEVYFGLNQASLQPAGRALLRRIVAELTTTYADATVTVLGFADPLGRPGRNAALSAERAQAVTAFLAGHGVAAGRISAAGYGTDLPAASSQASGAQPLDRRAVVIIDPVG